MVNLEELIALARSGELDVSCVYGPDGDIEVDGRYLLAGYPNVVDDVEVYPPEVSAAGLRLLYSGDQFADVVEVAFDQVPDASPAQIAESLKYYAEHDTFLDR